MNGCLIPELERILGEKVASGAIRLPWWAGGPRLHGSQEGR